MIYYPKVNINLYKIPSIIYIMDKINIPASITLERSFSTKKYKWKSREKFSEYKSSNRRAVIRFSSKLFAEKVCQLKKEDRQIIIKFRDKSNVLINRINTPRTTIQGYKGNHSYIQIVINRYLPKELWERLDKSDKKSITFSVNVELSLHEWKDISLSPSNFLLEVERESKTLLDKALNVGFETLRVSKGRNYDVGLITPNKKKLIIAISSHVARTKSRSKEKTIQKILMDISKMLPYLEEHKNSIPVVITRPIEFEKSWSFTTTSYLDFYRNKFGFRFLTTEFKNGWEDDIIKELSKI